MLYAEVLDRLGSLPMGLVVVAVIALAALGVALWELLDNAGDPDREDASRVRVERLADRVDGLETQLGEAASEGGVAAIRAGQRALQQRVQALEGRATSLGRRPKTSRRSPLRSRHSRTAWRALEPLVEVLEQQQPWGRRRIDRHSC